MTAADPPIRRILAVCAGNICRSPAAEAAIRRAGLQAGLELEIDSAGTGSWHLGQPPHPRSVAAAARVGLELSGTARQVSPADLESFDLVVAMDRWNHDDLLAIAPDPAARAKIRMFRPDGQDVPDPYHGSERDYEDMIAIVVPAAEALVARLTAGKPT
jgi:protein-tyrosine phosphatase